MRTLSFGVLTFALSICLAGKTAFAEVLHSPVVDQTRALSDGERTDLEARLRNFRQRTGAWMVVFFPESLGQRSIEEVAVESFRKWKIGQAKVDNGLLLVIALKEKKMRLEVGYGLEGAIPDILARSTLDEVLRPRLREGRITDGVQEVMARFEPMILKENLKFEPTGKLTGASTIFWTAVLLFSIPILASIIWMLKSAVRNDIQDWANALGMSSFGQEWIALYNKTAMRPYLIAQSLFYGAQAIHAAIPFGGHRLFDGARMTLILVLAAFLAAFLSAFYALFISILRDSTKENFKYALLDSVSPEIKQQLLTLWARGALQQQRRNQEAGIGNSADPSFLGTGSSGDSGFSSDSSSSLDSSSFSDGGDSGGGGSSSDW